MIQEYSLYVRDISRRVSFDICFYFLNDPWHGLYVSGTLSTYPSPKPTFALSEK